MYILYKKYKTLFNNKRNTIHHELYSLKITFIYMNLKLTFSSDIKYWKYKSELYIIYSCFEVKFYLLVFFNKYTNKS